MGSLTVTVGALSASLPFNNVKGKAIIEGYIASQAGPVTGTDQEKLDWFVTQLGIYVRDRHQHSKLQVAIDSAIATTEAGVEQWN